MLDLSPKLSSEGSLTQSAREAFSSNSSLVFTGRQILSALFGASQATVRDAVGTVSGLRTGDAATVLSITALVVTGFIANRIRAERMNVHDVRRKLQSESDGIRNALPGSLQVLLEPARVTPSSPVVHVTRNRNDSQ